MMDPHFQMTHNEAACGGSALTAELEGETMKKQYAVACSMANNDGRMYKHTTTLHINEAHSLEEAKGLAIDSAMEMKPGFAVAQVVATEIPKPSNACGEPGLTEPGKD